MPSKRKYNVKGTNDFLVLAAIFFFLCLWAIKDAWYPSEKVLKKHPRQIEARFESNGTVEKVFVKAGETVRENQPLVKLRTERLTEKYDAAKKAFGAAKKKHQINQIAVENARKNGASDDGIAELEANLAEDKTAMDQALAEVNDLNSALDAATLKAESDGDVLVVNASMHGLVESGDVAVSIKPKDNFYVFNQSLAVFSFLAFWVFLALHVLGR